MKLLTIIGNLGADAKITENNGIKQIQFSVAVNDSYKDAENNKIERTDWITVFSKQLSLAQYLLKGGKVFVQGNYNSRIYVDNNRQQRIGNTINAQIIQLLSSKADGNVTPAATPEPIPSLPAAEVPGAGTDDLPF